MSCNMCGLCCMRICIPRVGFREMRSFLTNNPQFRFFDVCLSSGREIPVFSCSWLVASGDVQHICAHYDARPCFCREYPDIRDTCLPAGCSMRS
jgi:Fe-S-cluster containining protein